MKIAAVCLLSVVPVRVLPGHREEMVTQLVFGDYVFISDRIPGWWFVTLASDGYSGWVEEKQMHELPHGTIVPHVNEKSAFVSDAVAYCYDTENPVHPIILGYGTCLPAGDNGNYIIGGRTYWISLGVKPLVVPTTGNDIVLAALPFLHTTYLWGGRTIFGVDCSGFIQTVYAVCGIPLPRDASQQADLGEEIKGAANALSGDLVFFNDEEGKLSHVGLYIGEDRIIHASGSVKIDFLDHTGIRQNGSPGYSHRLSHLRRFIFFEK